MRYLHTFTKIIFLVGLFGFLVGCGNSGSGSSDDSDNDPIIYTLGGKGPAGGWVFYITDGGLHGLEASPIDLTTAPWGCSGLNLQGADGEDVGTGAANTLDILTFCPETPIAADVAIFYTLNGFSDWFLPSKDELELMYLNIGQGSTTIGNVGGFSNIFYWSSTELTDIQASALSFGGQFGDGIPCVCGKTRSHGVRAARAF
jgi:hypothetical protein